MILVNLSLMTFHQMKILLFYFDVQNSLFFAIAIYLSLLMCLGTACSLSVSLTALSLIFNACFLINHLRYKIRFTSSCWSYLIFCSRKDDGSKLILRLMLDLLAGKLIFMLLDCFMEFLSRKEHLLTLICLLLKGCLHLHSIHCHNLLDLVGFGKTNFRYLLFHAMNCLLLEPLGNLVSYFQLLPIHLYFKSRPFLFFSFFLSFF